MRRAIFAVMMLVPIILIGCSTARMPVNPSDELAKSGTIGNTDTSVLMSGSFMINPEDMSISTVENRTNLLNYNITGFLSWACEGGCFKFRILSISGIVLEIELEISNPTALQVYDVRLIYWNLYGKTVLDPDSYTDLFSKGFIRPFTAFAKESPARAFPAGPGAKDMEIMHLDFPPGAQAAVDYIVVASFPLNTEDPYEISDIGVSGPLTTTGGSSTISCMVKDHQDNVTAVYADTTALTGGITDLIENPSNPGEYSADITNSQGASEGDYIVLITSESPNVHQAKTYNYCVVTVEFSQQGPGKIVFTSWRDGNPEIYRMMGDGTGVQRLTNMGDHDWEPCWSPDGTMIAWREGGYSGANIWIMNEDGTGKQKVTTNGNNFDPDWDPSGQWIYFWSWNGTGGGDTHIWRVKVDGTGQEQVTFYTDGAITSPCVSPNGDMLAFEYGGSQDPRDLWVCDIDGSNLTRLTNTSTWDAYPEFTPDGEKIVYSSDESGTFRLYLINTDGSNKQPLTNPPSGQYDFSGCYSLPGEMILWSRFNPSTMDYDEITKLDIATGVYTKLTNDSTADCEPDWFPSD